MPIYLKFDGLGGDFAHDSVNDAFLKIDQDFNKLASASSDTFLKVESEPAIKHNCSHWRLVSQT